MIKLVLIGGLCAIYGVRFRPAVITRIFKTGLVNSSVLVLELMGFMFALYAIWIIQIDSTILGLIGLIIYTLGIIFTSTARLQLGSNYMPAFSANTPDSLEANGLFAVVRNPIYLGMFLAIFGFVIIFDYRIALFTPVLFLVFKNMIKKEEKLLSSSYPAEWKNYEEKTRYRLIPLIW